MKSEIKEKLIDWVEQDVTTARESEDHDLVEALREVIQWIQSSDQTTTQTELREALRKSTQALNDWISVYAAQFCDEARVKEARDRISDHGGTLAYVTDIVCANQRFLKD